MAAARHNPKNHNSLNSSKTLVKSSREPRHEKNLVDRDSDTTVGCKMRNKELRKNRKHDVCVT